MAKKGKTPDDICLIYATAPLINIRDIVKSCEISKRSEKEFLFVASEFKATKYRVFTTLNDGTVKMIHPEYCQANSQDLPKAYYNAGQFCWGRSQAVLDPGSVVFLERAIPFVLPANRVIDIDTIDNWIHA